ncbi:MAG: hypothetical protein D3906_06765 [Candidatus Electrothrix sp. AUS1_2]|nr:hypothetical protein [Candidatus Electrothrix sp. AUS1_2]
MMPFMKKIASIFLGLLLLSVFSRAFSAEEGLPLDIELLDGTFHHGASLHDYTSRISSIKHALQNGANVNVMLPASAESPFWGTALMASSFVNDVCALKILLDNGADVNLIASDGTTALIAAVLKGSIDAAALLIKHGANINMIGYQGKTALMIAQEEEDEDMVAVLQGRIVSKMPQNNTDDHNLYGTKWGACDWKSKEKVCAFDPFDKCQFPVTEATVTFSFLADGVSIKAGSSTQSISNIDIAKLHNELGYNIDFKSVVRSAFKRWDNCSGITFQEVDSSDTVANIRIGAYALPIDQAQRVVHAKSYRPPYLKELSKEYFGDIYFNSANTFIIRNMSKDEVKRRFYLIALHEIGHAIGLKHNNKESIMIGDSDRLFSMEPFLYDSDQEQAAALYSYNYPLAECIPWLEHSPLNNRNF